MIEVDLYSATGNVLWVGVLDDLQESQLFQYADITRSLCVNKQADGLLLVNGKTHEVWMLNLDGSNGGFCGNGLRAVAFHLAKLQQQLDLKIELNMSGVTMQADCVGDVVELVLDPKISPIQPIQLDGVNAYTLNVPNPHCVVVDCPPSWRFPDQAKAICENLNHNVEFVKAGASKDCWSVLVYERGAGPTGACGSGALATFKVLQYLGLVEKEVCLAFPGGNLTVREQGAKLLLSGSVKWVKKTCI